MSRIREIAENLATDIREATDWDYGNVEYRWKAEDIEAAIREAAQPLVAALWAHSWLATCCPGEGPCWCRDGMTYSANDSEHDLGCQQARAALREWEAHEKK